MTKDEAFDAFMLVIGRYYASLPTNPSPSDGSAQTPTGKSA